MLLRTRLLQLHGNTLTIIALHRVSKAPADTNPVPPPQPSKSNVSCIGCTPPEFWETAADHFLARSPGPARVDVARNLPHLVDPDPDVMVLLLEAGKVATAAASAHQLD